MSIQLVPEEPQSFKFQFLTERQKIEGSILTTDQEQVVQNERATIAEQLIGMQFDPVNPMQFGLDQAFLQGQLATFKWLLDASSAAKVALVELAKQLQEIQNPDQQFE